MAMKQGSNMDCDVSLDSKSTDESKIDMQTDVQPVADHEKLLNDKLISENNDNVAAPIAANHPKNELVSDIKFSAEANISMESNSSKELNDDSQTKRAKTKGNLKKQLELKKGRVRNTIFSDNESAPSPGYPISDSNADQRMESASKLPLDTLTIPTLTPTHKPLKETFETLVKWSIGDMFWARVTGHPWWPCMIYKDPTNMLFTKMIRVNRGYHFHFFGNNSERGWVLEPSMIQFEGKEKFEEHRKEKLDQANRMVAKSVSEKITKIALQSFEIKPHRLEAWNEAVEEAARVFLMPVEERIKYVEEILAKNKTKDSPKKSKSKLTSTSLVGGVAMKRKHEDDVNDEVAGDGDANESNSEEKRPVKKQKRDSSGGILKIKLNYKTPDFHRNEVEDNNNNNNTASDISNDINKNANNNDNGCSNNSSHANINTNNINNLKVARIKKSTKFQTTPERASATKYQLRTVRKLKSLTDDDDDDGDGDGEREAVNEDGDVLNAKSERDAKLLSSEKPRRGRKKKNSIALSQSQDDDDDDDNNDDLDGNDEEYRNDDEDEDDDEEGKDDANDNTSDDTSSNLSSSKTSATKHQKRLEKEAKRSLEILKLICQNGNNGKKDDVCLKCYFSTAGVVRCKGPCHGSYHPECVLPTGGCSTQVMTVNEDKKVVGDDLVKREDAVNGDSGSGNVVVGNGIATDGGFMCPECLEGTHTCFICKRKEYTPDNDNNSMTSSTTTLASNSQSTTPTKKSSKRSMSPTKSHKQLSMTTKALKCNVNNCSFYYHVNCLKTLKYGKCEKRSLTCSHHTCASCAADAEKMGMAERGKMLKCIVCPNAYHTGDLCIAAGSRILSNGWIICGDHHQMSDNKRKHQEHVNVAWCFSCGEGGSLVCCENCPASFHPACCETPPSEEEKWICELCLDGKRPLYGEIVWCKAGIYRWWPGEICHPRNVPTNIQNIAHGIGDFPVRFFGSYDYLWTHKGRVFSFQEGDKKGAKRGSSKSFVEVFSKALDEADVAARIYYDERNKKDLKVYDKKPGPYKHVKSNVPIGKVEIFKVPLTEIPRCQCSPEMPSPCGPDSDCINRLMMYECDVAVCPAGEMCLNRAIQSRWDVDTEYFRTADNRGWGLRTKADIKKGQFIHEYVGDLIDEEECKERLRRAKESNVTNFYMLTLDKNRIIDAGPKGNNSRFMNHSCQPNCETQKWNVNGDVRVGLFAMRFIEAGEELTFNYNFDCLGDKKTICHCGTPVCSGFLGERPKSTSAEVERTLITKKKKRRARNVTKDLIVHEDLCFRCGLGGELVLCDKTGCTKSYHLDCLNLNHLPRGKWICPWHLCNEENCGKWSSQLCSMCPNSFCSRHTEGNIIVLATGRIVCDDHPPSCPQLQYLLSKDWEELKSRDNNVADADHNDSGLPVIKDGVEKKISILNSFLVSSDKKSADGVDSIPPKRKRGRPRIKFNSSLTANSSQASNSFFNDLPTSALYTEKGVIRNSTKLMKKQRSKVSYASSDGDKLEKCVTETEKEDDDSRPSEGKMNEALDANNDSMVTSTTDLPDEIKISPPASLPLSIGHHDEIPQSTVSYGDQAAENVTQKNVNVEEDGPSNKNGGDGVGNESCSLENEDAYDSGCKLVIDESMTSSPVKNTLADLRNNSLDSPNNDAIKNKRTPKSTAGKISELNKTPEINSSPPTTYTTINHSSANNSTASNGHVDSDPSHLSVNNHTSSVLDKKRKRNPLRSPNAKLPKPPNPKTDIFSDNVEYCCLTDPENPATVIDNEPNEKSKTSGEISKKVVGMNGHSNVEAASVAANDPPKSSTQPIQSRRSSRRCEPVKRHYE